MQRRLPVRFICCAMLMLTALAGCGGGSGNSSASPATSLKSMQITSNAANQGSISVGQTFTLTPHVSGANGGTLTFSVTNAASWMSFNSSTGVLKGTPTASQVGTYPNIVISVTDGSQNASTAPFTITVLAAGAGTGTADVSWTPPVTNTDGSTLTDLAGYKIYYGTSATALTQRVQIANPGITNYDVTGLASGTWYFAVAAYTTAGTQSGLSNIASKTIS